MIAKAFLLLVAITLAEVKPLFSQVGGEGKQASIYTKKTASKSLINSTLSRSYSKTFRSGGDAESNGRVDRQGDGQDDIGGNAGGAVESDVVGKKLRISGGYAGSDLKDVAGKNTGDITVMATGVGGGAASSYGKKTASKLFTNSTSSKSYRKIYRAGDDAESNGRGDEQGDIGGNAGGAAGSDVVGKKLSSVEDYGGNNLKSVAGKNTGGKTVMAASGGASTAASSYAKKTASRLFTNSISSKSYSKTYRTDGDAESNEKGDGQDDICGNAGGAVESDVLGKKLRISGGYPGSYLKGLAGKNTGDITVMATGVGGGAASSYAKKTASKLFTNSTSSKSYRKTYRAGDDAESNGRGDRQGDIGGNTGGNVRSDAVSKKVSSEIDYAGSDLKSFDGKNTGSITVMATGGGGEVASRYAKKTVTKISTNSKKSTMYRKTHRESDY